jgi:hypothetical protein
MVSIIPYVVSFISLLLVFKIISKHKPFAKFSDIISVSLFITLLVLFFDAFAGKAPDYAVIVFAFFISYGVTYFYWKHDDYFYPLICAVIYTLVWLSMQLWITLIIVVLAIIVTFIYYLKFKIK